MSTTRFSASTSTSSTSAAANALCGWLSSQVDAEDVDALAQVARGLRSGFAPRSKFAPEQERGVHWFHRLVSRSVA